MAIVYKIFRAAEYAEFLSTGRTVGAPIDVEDGYIHMSTADQVGETVAKYFAGVDGLKILGIETEDLGDALKWEPSRGGALFPHLYRELVASDVTYAKDLPLVDGVHRFEGVLA